MDGLPSLSLVTTAKGGRSGSLMPFWATSAATAQAARMAAQITATYPEYWPETVRALIAHSARWTRPMEAMLAGGKGSTDRSALRRRFGYGVPDPARAMASASSDLALIAQSTIQPFRRAPVERTGPDGRLRRRTETSFGNAHYYALPWPRKVLEDLDNEIVRLKVALSYFVEPNPSGGGLVDPRRYQSYGLRFDLRRSSEALSDYYGHTNAAAPSAAVKRQPDSGWLFGFNSVSAGSLHVDTWEGPAVELAARDHLCIRPITGWWRERESLGRVNDEGRYALVIGLETPDVEIDLHTPIQTAVDAVVSAEVSVETGP